MWFEPQLEHNREEDARLRHRKWQALAVVLLSALPFALLVPVDVAPFASFAFLLITFSAFLYLEFRRFQVFRRDLRERESAGEANR